MPAIAPNLARGAPGLGTTENLKGEWMMKALSRHLTTVAAAALLVGFAGTAIAAGVVGQSELTKAYGPAKDFAPVVPGGKPNAVGIAVGSAIPAGSTTAYPASWVIFQDGTSIEGRCNLSLGSPSARGPWFTSAPGEAVLISEDGKVVVAKLDNGDVKAYGIQANFASSGRPCWGSPTSTLDLNTAESIEVLANGDYLIIGTKAGNAAVSVFSID